MTTSPNVRIRKMNGLHVVQIWSVPTQQWIAQGEWRTEEEAKSDAATWMSFDQI